MLVLFETAAGYAIFKLLDEKKLQQSDNLYKDFETPEKASNVVKLKQFLKFEDTTEALAAATAVVEGKLGKGLKKLLKKAVVSDLHEELAVADAKLGSIIKEKFQVSCVYSSAVQELMRGIRSQEVPLISGLEERELAAMSLGLAHSLSRYKLKFSPEKVDTMIVQAISLLDELDKELNNCIMRAREWYGWHFPELGKIVADNTAYVKTVKELGMKSTAATCDLSKCLPEEIEAEVKSAAEISMGTEISDEDLLNIRVLCDQVLEMSEYRGQLYDYLRNRMMAIAPNVTVLVGELVGARLIAHAGSLLSLAKHPASTVQILGAEKALFRALKTKHDTPKYGLIYHASLIGQCSSKLKGKMSRMLAAKTALACRVDALGEETNLEIGVGHKATLESRLKILEDQGPNKGRMGKQSTKFDKYEHKSEVKPYNASADFSLPQKRNIEDVDADSTPKQKQKKMKIEKSEDDSTPKQKQKKMKIEKSEDEGEINGVAEHSEKKKKKKRKKHSEDEGGLEDVDLSVSREKKKTKKIKSESDA